MGLQFLYCSLQLPSGPVKALDRLTFKALHAQLTPFSFLKLVKRGQNTDVTYLLVGRKSAFAQQFKCIHETFTEMHFSIALVGLTGMLG